MSVERSAYLKSELGIIRIKGAPEGITSVNFVDDEEKFRDDAEGNPYYTVMECLRQLREYFRGERMEFDVELIMKGTEFQTRVWKELARIPYGKTLSYGAVADRIGNPGAARAVGGANNRNRIAIIVPCHRVIGCRGGLVGYGKGLHRKKWLLEMEKKNSGSLYST